MKEAEIRIHFREYDEAITSGEVNCLSGSCEPCEKSSESSNSGNDRSNSVLEFE